MAIDAYLGKGDGFTEAMVAFAGRYADQNAADHAQLVAAIAVRAVRWRDPAEHGGARSARPVGTVTAVATVAR